MKFSSLACLYLLGIAVAAAAAAQSPDGVPAVSSRQLAVADRVVLAGVPDLDKLQRLPPATTVVVDLRTAAEGIAEEAQLLQEEGYEYHNIPVAGATIEPAQLEALRAIAAANADQPAQTLIVHCRSGNRAAMLWGAHLLEEGQSLEQAMQTVGPALTGADTRRALLDFSARRDAAGQP